jgi:hypothetical protein
MTVLISLATWLGGGFLLALLLGAVLSFSEQNEAAELEILLSWEMTRMRSHEVTRAPLVEAEQNAGWRGAGHVPAGTLVPPDSFAELHSGASDGRCY